MEYHLDRQSTHGASCTLKEPRLYKEPSGNFSRLSAFPVTTPTGLALLRKRDLEPGRCWRRDGKRWRCPKKAVEGKKYYEQHMGRRRTKKGQTSNEATVSSGLDLTAQNTPARYNGHV